MKTLTLILAFLAVPFLAFGATYYVDYSLGADCAGGAGTSYRIAERDCGASDGTIAYNEVKDLDTVVGAGDAVYIRECDETFANDDGMSPDYAAGASENDRITYSSYNGETVIFRGDPSSINFIILDVSNSYYTFEDIEFRDITSGGAVFNSGDQNIFKDLIIDNCDNGTYGACFYIGRPDPPNVAIGTVIDNIYMDEIGGVGNSIDGIALKCAQSTLITGGYIGRVTHAGITAYTCDDDYDHKVLITGVTFEQKWRYAINYFWNSSDEAGEYIVEKSIFKNQGTITNPYPADECGLNIHTSSTTDMVIRFNEFYNGNAGIGLSCGGIDYQDTSVYVFHNTLYGMHDDCTSGESYMQGMMVAGDLSNANRVNYNNVRIQNNIFSETAQSWGMLINFNLNSIPTSTSKNPVNSRWEANIFYDSTDYSENRIDEWINGEGKKHCTGWEDSDGTQWIDGTCFTIQNPNLTDPSNADFTLQSDSIAIDAGVFLATQSGAPSGNTITVGSGEARYFFSKETYGITYAGVVSDTIYDADGNSSVITAINYAADTITLTDATGFTHGDKLTMVNWKGEGVDIGVSEYLPSATEQSDISGLELN
jgi:hypothetical protein